MFTTVRISSEFSCIKFFKSLRKRGVAGSGSFLRRRRGSSTTSIPTVIPTSTIFRIQRIATSLILRTPTTPTFPAMPTSTILRSLTIPRNPTIPTSTMLPKLSLLTKPEWPSTRIIRERSQSLVPEIKFIFLSFKSN